MKPKTDTTFELKRCPFCNSHDLILDTTEVTYAIHCLCCGAVGPDSTKLNRAIWLWNGEYAEKLGGNPSALVYSRKSNRDDKKAINL